MPKQEIVDAALAHARTAFDRGDAILQVPLEIGHLAGESSAWGSSENLTVNDPDVGWLLGHIEGIGWRFEHATTVFVETGSSSSARVLSTGEGVVTRGEIVGYYLFRRASA
ncbi:hypothetical protein [Homoserinibacter sp. GY 40078]|uniref:hypothetical protein n=1 Tax=Homoserinibacter sp. GY 40078 TaxID=2603275 RepID=UPI0011CB5115|nr:hypothetical protein [Homoserinibacter sp. GY 40078]TXK17659.1 hypothetical protein FVQ89_12695 [Homoserinibacter sp. GY 40078]